MYESRVKLHFDAAHHLEGYQGKCARPHGHRWEVEVILQGNTLDSLNMLIDFGDVKAVLERIMDESLDHYDLNTSLFCNQPTAEYLARWIFEKFVLTGGSTIVKYLCAVTVWESPDCSITYRPDNLNKTIQDTLFGGL